jgi:hypothetical protein
MDDVWIWLIVPLYCAWVATTWIRAKYGYPPQSGPEREIFGPRRAASVASLSAELSARDARIERLEERIRVLERIATDSALDLEREFEALRSGTRPTSC